ncbi:ornithine carbamoyltransferase [Phytohabitans rumicis]|uniref:Ornithine carbamoyltransferase n=1 Tax=Phytohabitans rumicis TaxID=1076125 RepID=A0A6V8LM96_9ACTN|nr:ornithine carbamoyltransferase [Phytohabitans rumicis]GFJ93755.1 ornithine carbamoyltransferase [Phytohabitans rumicis]
MPNRRHLISLDDLDDDDLSWIVRRGAWYASGGHAEPLRDDIVALLFRNTSTRTRTAFSAGALRLGARLITYGPDDLQLNTGETTGDTAAVLSRMVDVLVVRSANGEEVREYATSSRMGVVNAMSAAEHPTQALADLTTMSRHFGAVDGLRVLYVGEGNNTASALCLGLTRFPGTELHLRTPPGYGVAPSFVERAELLAKASDARIEQRHDMDDLPEVDVVYTTRWQTTGTTKPTADWRVRFAPFQVNQAVMDRCPAAVFMHDLPAHRGEEVTAEVLDGPASIAFDQAENKFHSGRSVLEWCSGRTGGKDLDPCLTR